MRGRRAKKIERAQRAKPPDMKDGACSASSLRTAIKFRWNQAINLTLSLQSSQIQPRIAACQALKFRRAKGPVRRGLKSASDAIQRACGVGLAARSDVELRREILRLDEPRRTPPPSSARMRLGPRSKRCCSRVVLCIVPTLFWSCREAMIPPPRQPLVRGTPCARPSSKLPARLSTRRGKTSELDHSWC
jgi:hypothetical protein